MLRSADVQNERKRAASILDSDFNAGDFISEPSSIYDDMERLDKNNDAVGNDFADNEAANNLSATKRFREFSKDVFSLKSFGLSADIHKSETDSGTPTDVKDSFSAKKNEVEVEQDDYDDEKIRPTKPVSRSKRKLSHKQTVRFSSPLGDPDSSEPSLQENTPKKHKKRSQSYTKPRGKDSNDFSYQIANVRSTPNLLENYGLLSGATESTVDFNKNESNLYSGISTDISEIRPPSTPYEDKRIVKSFVQSPPSTRPPSAKTPRSRPPSGRPPTANLKDVEDQTSSKKKNKNSGSEVIKSGMIDAISPPSSVSTSARTSRAGTIKKSIKEDFVEEQKEEMKTKKFSEKDLDDLKKSFQKSDPNKYLDEVYNLKYDQLSGSTNDNMDAFSPSDFPTSLPHTGTHQLNKESFFNEMLTPITKRNASNKSGKLDDDVKKLNSGISDDEKNEEDDINARSISVVFRPQASNGDDGGKKSPGVDSTIFKPKKKFSLSIVLLFLFAFLFVAAISVCIPMIIMLMNGTESGFNKYFNRQLIPTKTRLLENLGNRLNGELKNQSMGFHNGYIFNTTSVQTPMKNIHQLDNQSSNYYQEVNSFKGLNLPYRNDKEIIKLMNDSRLQNVFYGIDYAPKGVIYPICGVTEKEVMLDLALLSKITTRIRTYGMQCDQQTLILDSIQKLGLNMSLALGVWIGGDSNLNNKEISSVKQVLQKYPKKLFNSIYVGNEVLFREENTPRQIAKYITDVKDFVKKRLNWTDIPVGVSEIGSKIHTELIDASDIVGANIHPFFSGNSVDNATNWVFDYLNKEVSHLNGKANIPSKIVISEIGWPSGGGEFLNSQAGNAEMQKFLNQWICKAQKSSYPWYWFEAFDEPWKNIYHTRERTWETQWGLFYTNRTLKEGIVFPNCT